MIKFTQQQAEENLARAKAHFAVDEMLVKGHYGKINGSFKGCSIGCQIYDLTGEINEDSPHEQLEGLTGIPEWFLRLQDCIFEGLPEPENRAWHVDVAQALKDACPINFELLLHRIHIAILRVSHKKTGPSGEVVQRVLNLHQRSVDGEDVSLDDWSAARSAASAEWSAEAAAYQDIRDGVLQAIAGEKS